jgi:hypothetical protein
VNIAFPANWNDFVANMIDPRYSSCIEALPPSCVVLVPLSHLGTPNSKLVLSDVESLTSCILKLIVFGKHVLYACYQW